MRGLMMDGHRKSMEPMAHRLGVDHQGLQQFLTDSPWSHQQVLRKVALLIHPTVWVVDDVSFPKDGTTSPGVAHQYCGALGKTANCQVAPSVHLATEAASPPGELAVVPACGMGPGPRGLQRSRPRPQAPATGPHSARGGHRPK
ncbi:hypothetical protein Pta02_30920 [Planobispora takensis]|uniref:Transposase IS701-like DDE domain-containing protein n=1 Tax=Planobispora takensis TaxID=1367882 RepID=A0A8J3T4Y6_9ACTN|nr:hypothetical protein Pta02_30920 [Planobispora takensis]